MHSIDTRNQFLKLRLQGLSFNRIAALLGVSKPTLISWSRQCHPQIQTRQADTVPAHSDAPKLCCENELQNLNHKIKTIRQELNSRLLRNISTEQLHCLLNHLEQKLGNLEAVKKSTLPASPVSA